MLKYYFRRDMRGVSCTLGPQRICYSFTQFDASLRFINRIVSDPQKFSKVIAKLYFTVKYVAMIKYCERRVNDEYGTYNSDTHINDGYGTNVYCNSDKNRSSSI